MIIWNGYVSEHSMNLVLIGRFKKEQDAEKIEKDIKKLSTQAEKDECYSIPFDRPEYQRFSDEMLSILRVLKINTLAPTDLSELVSDHHLSREGDRITITTDESEGYAFVKQLIEAGAKGEIFSAHD